MIQTLMLSFQSLCGTHAARPLSGHSHGGPLGLFWKFELRMHALPVAALLLASCVSPSEARAQVRPAAPVERKAAPVPARPVIVMRGVDSVIGKDANTLKRLFGEPRLDVVEVYGRKLQFVGKPCVLDAFLYPERKGGREVVTYVDARRSDGTAVDRTACIDALLRR
jgi:hypothetical protein